LKTTTTYSLTDIIAQLISPKNWTIENKSIHFAFQIHALVAPTFLGKTLHLVALQAIKNSSCPRCGYFYKLPTGKG
jgi:hypothetical protein